MNNKSIKLTEGSKCNSCGKNHLPPYGLYEQIKWYLENAEGYHRTACSDFNPTRYPAELLLKLLEVFELKQVERIPILPSNVSLQDFLEGEKAVMKALENTKKRTI